MDLKGLREHFERSKARVQAFAVVHGQEMTQRQRRKDGKWLPVHWSFLCTEAVHYYTELIADIDKGVYVRRYKGVGGGE